MLRNLSLLFAGGCLMLVNAAPSSIGTVKSPGAFRVDGAAVSGNSTVFDGNLVETETARSIVRLTGAQITLSPQSRAKVFRDRTVLENGSSSLRDSDKYVIEAATLSIAPSSHDSVLRVEMYTPNHVAVSATSGSADVRNAQGTLVASVRPGMALAFDPGAGASAATRMSGILQSKGSAFLLRDSTTNVTVELRGKDLAKYVGKQVTVTGSVTADSPAASEADKVVQVIGISADGNGKKKAAAAGAVGGAAAGAGAAAGMSTAAIAVIVGGVAVAATTAGLAAAGTLSESSSLSRQ